MVISKNLIARELLPKASNLKLLKLEISEQGWGVAAEGNNSAVCPNCATRSSSRHSRYHRKLQDLPVQGSPVRLHLQVGRWRCGNDGCPRKIFTERVPVNAADQRFGASIHGHSGHGRLALLIALRHD